MVTCITIWLDHCIRIIKLQKWRRAVRRSLLRQGDNLGVGERKIVIILRTVNHKQQVISRSVCIEALYKIQQTICKLMHWLRHQRSEGHET